jgi:tetratricopeptide (TPR) repeat protein
LATAYAQQGQIAKAVASNRQAVRLRPTYQKAWRNLAADCAGLGLTDEAIAAAKAAADVARRQNRPELASEAENWLAQYRATLGK